MITTPGTSVRLPETSMPNEEAFCKFNFLLAFLSKNISLRIMPVHQSAFAFLGNKMFPNLLTITQKGSIMNLLSQKHC